MTRWLTGGVTICLTGKFDVICRQKCDILLLKNIPESEEPLSTCFTTNKDTNKIIFAKKERDNLYHNSHSREL